MGLKGRVATGAARRPRDGEVHGNGLESGAAVVSGAPPAGQEFQEHQEEQLSKFSSSSSLETKASARQRWSWKPRLFTGSWRSKSQTASFCAADSHYVPDLDPQQAMSCMELGRDQRAVLMLPAKDAGDSEDLPQTPSSPRKPSVYVDWRAFSGRKVGTHKYQLFDFSRGIWRSLPSLRPPPAVAGGAATVPGTSDQPSDTKRGRLSDWWGEEQQRQEESLTTNAKALASASEAAQGAMAFISALELQLVLAAVVNEGDDEGSPGVTLH